VTGVPPTVGALAAGAPGAPDGAPLSSVEAAADETPALSWVVDAGRSAPRASMTEGIDDGDGAEAVGDGFDGDVAADAAVGPVPESAVAPVSGDRVRAVAASGAGELDVDVDGSVVTPSADRPDVAVP
jgi:hypothetical protein